MADKNVRSSAKWLGITREFSLWWTLARTVDGDVRRSAEIVRMQRGSLDRRSDGDVWTSTEWFPEYAQPLFHASSPPADGLAVRSHYFTLNSPSTFSHSSFIVLLRLNLLPPLFRRVIYNHSQSTEIWGNLADEKSITSYSLTNTSHPLFKLILSELESQGVEL